MSGSLASLPTPPGRSYYLRLIGAAIALFVVIGALVRGALAIARQDAALARSSADAVHPEVTP